MVFESNYEFGGAAKKFACTCINRFDEARVDDGGVEACSGKFGGGLSGELEHVTQPEEGVFAAAIVGKVLDDFGFADFNELGLILNRDALGGTARIANESGMWLVGRGEHHVHEFIFVLGRHGDAIRH